MFTPRKLDPVALGGLGRLWGYLQGGHQYADYYLARDGTPTQAAVELHGKLFARLSLGQLDRRAFERLAAGCHPLTGQRLIKTSHALRRDRATGELVTRGGAHVPGIDCNLSPPKSVSAILPFVTAADRAALETAHLAAVRVTVRELEGRVAACRPTIDGEQIHAPGELAMASFTHHTSRPSPEVATEADRPPDPQLHSHVFVFNLAWCEPRPGQGRFLAVDSRPIFQFGATAEAVYQCELATQLQRLGYQLDWHQTRKGRVWELAGVDQQALDLFSSRHRHIDQLATRFQQEKGRPPTKLERRRLAQQDRLAKTSACRTPHWPAYRQVLDRHRLAPPCPERTLVHATAPRGEREATLRARLLGPDGLTGQDATFDEATVTKLVFQSAAGLLTVEEAAGFLARFLQGPDLVPVVVDGQPRLTTTALLAQERAIVQAARTKVTTTVPAPTGAMIQRAAAEVARQAGYELSAEQHQVVAHLCAPVGWVSLEGWAGTGKTTAVRTVVRAYRHNQQPLVAVSTAADTARRIAHELDLDQGYTVEAFCLAVQQGRLHPDERMVVIVEEACMVDTHRMHRLLQAAGPAIIRTLGDPEQAQAVGAAGWHTQVDQAIGGHAGLTTVVRQKDPADREICRLIRQGDADQALANLNARGRVHLVPHASSAVKEVVYAWDRHRRDRGLEGVKIVTDTSNATIDTLNSLCQARRRRAGELSWPSVELVDRDAGRREQIYTGDRVRFIRPYRAEDGERVANGTAGAVAHVDLLLRRVTVACDDGRQVPVELEGREWAQPLRLGYAGHALRLQGGQAEVVLVLPGSWQTSRQSAYSMVTRCVEELHVFVDRDSQCTGEYAQHDPLAVLAQRWTRDARKLAASERLADLERDEEPAPVGDAARRADTLLHNGWELLCSAQAHERSDLEDDDVRVALSVSSGIWPTFRDGNGTVAGSEVSEDAGHVMSSVSIASYRTWPACRSNASSTLPTGCRSWPAPGQGRWHAPTAVSPRSGCTAATDDGSATWRWAVAGW
jgi:conjugative relaxase-like TrwC/TraI family protein